MEKEFARAGRWVADHAHREHRDMDRSHHPGFEDLNAYNITTANNKLWWNEANELHIQKTGKTQPVTPSEAAQRLRKRQLRLPRRVPPTHDRTREKKDRSTRPFGRNAFLDYADTPPGRVG